MHITIIQLKQDQTLTLLFRFLRWAISVYSRGGHTAYEAMKNIMRLPSVSTLKSYMNESQ